METALQGLGRSARSFVIEAAELWRLGRDTGIEVVLAPFRRRLRWAATREQAVIGGYRSFPLVALICSLVGMILAFQSAYQLRELGALDLVPSLVALSVLRELAPLLTAIIVIGRFGSAITAEIGTMKVRQEVDALAVMGIDPVAFLVVPRFVALLFTLPSLVIFADVVGILGGLAVTVGVLNMGAIRYVELTLDSLVLQDVYIGLCKGVAFAIIVALVSCHQGLGTYGGADAVGRATTSSVVRSIILVMFADLVVTVAFYVAA